LAGYQRITLDAFQQVKDNLAALRPLEMENQQQLAMVPARETLTLYSPIVTTPPVIF
jgi:hypothetical protein